MGWILNEKDGSRIDDEDDAYLQSVTRALVTERGDRIGRPEYGVSSQRFKHDRFNDDTTRELNDEIREASNGLVEIQSTEFEEVTGGTRVTLNGEIQVVLKT